MSSMTVAVLRGGPSGEYEVSLQTGSTVLRNLPERYKPLDIFISKDGTWHRGGIAMKPGDALRHVDIVFNALHGEYGEDGKVQRLLEQLGLPYTGSDAIGSALGMNKPRAKEHFAKAGLKTAKHWLLSVTDDLKQKLLDIFRSFPLPFVVKPAAAGSSLGVSIVYSFSDLEAGVAKAFGYGPEVLVEEFVRGKEATCGVVEGFRGAALYPLFPVEIIPEGSFFDYDAKYRGRSQELCPSTFSPYEKRQIEKAAALAHQTLGLRHYSRSDFILSPRGVYILEVNTLPGLTPESLLPKELKAGGIELPEFFGHVLDLAGKR